MPSCALRVGLLALVVLLVGCAEEPAAPPPLVDLTDLARLVPEDATAVVGVPSLDFLQQVADAIANGLGQPRSGDVVDGLAELLPHWPGAVVVDRTRPLWVVLRDGPGDPTDRSVLVFAATDLDRARGRVEHLTWAEHGGYLAVTRDPTYVPGEDPGADLARLPDGVITARLDAARALQPLRPMAALMASTIASTGSTGPSGLDMGSITAAQLDFAFDSLDQVQTLDLAFDLQDGELIFRVAAEILPDSLLADLPPARCGQLDELTGMLTGEGAMQMVMAMDARAAADAMAASLPALSPFWLGDQEDAVIETLARLRVMGARCGHVWVGEGGLFGAESGYRHLFAAPDANDLAELMVESAAAGEAYTGVTSTVHQGEVDGFVRARVTSDMGALLDTLWADLPEEQLAVQKAIVPRILHQEIRASEGRVTVASGSEEGVERLMDLTGPGVGPSEPLRRALQRVDGAPTRMAMSFDMGSMFSSIAELSDLPPQLDGARLAAMPPVPIAAWVSGDGRTWTFGGAMGLDALSRLQKALGQS